MKICDEYKIYLCKAPFINHEKQVLHYFCSFRKRIASLDIEFYTGCHSKEFFLWIRWNSFSISRKNGAIRICSSLKLLLFSVYWRLLILLIIIINFLIKSMTVQKMIRYGTITIYSVYLFLIIPLSKFPNRFQAVLLCRIVCLDDNLTWEVKKHCKSLLLFSNKI